ncbi:protein translocase subunit SecD [Planctomycetota bacterium]|nr:protein translocase subunit SecD [Planctomycetota bacterium]
MWTWIKRWHPLIVVLFALYLAIPKPAPNPAEVPEDYLEKNDENADGFIDREEYTGTDFDLRDINKDGKLGVPFKLFGMALKWPLYAYHWNLGQDLQGGSSLRYRLEQQDLIEAEEEIKKLVKPLQENPNLIKGDGLEKFSALINDGELLVNEYDIRETAEDKDDFDLLQSATFDEGRVDALRRYYKVWNEGKQRKGDDLAGATIATLNSRLNSSGITELNIAALGENQLEIKLPKFSTTAETQRFKELLETTGKLEFRVLASVDGEYPNLEFGQEARDEGYKYKWMPLAKDDSVSQSSLVKEHEGQKYVPVQIIDDYGVTGKSLSEISAGTTQEGGMAVNFKFKGLAVAAFERLSDLHREDGDDPRLLAVVIDNKVYSAYNVKSKISGSVQLSGNFTTKERDDIINVLKSGSLNVALVLEGEESVGPSEGAESVSRGIWSLIIGAILVFILALILYSFGLGGLTILNLVTVGLLVMGALAAGLGTLTMPGIAGIVLTLGMAIDANILINERIREEFKKNPNTRGAAEEGFKNAASSIVDANVTTLLTAIILYRVGSGAIQGFALTLAIGIVATLYTALLSYRSMVFSILNIKRDVKFKMTSLGKLHSMNFNFLKLMPIGVAVSVVLVVSGSIMIIHHGPDALGMEFRGGHTFRVALKENAERPDIEKLFLNEDGTQLDWAMGLGIQPVMRFNSDESEGSGADRYDFRFPMQNEWVGRDEEVNKELRGKLAELLKENIAANGWTVGTSGVTEIVLEAKVKLAVTDEEQFTRLLADSDRQSQWLVLSRNWKGDPNAAQVNKDKWFGGISPTSVKVTAETDPDGVTQVVDVVLTGVAVKDAADVEAKKAEFAKALNEELLPQSSESVGYAPEGDTDFISFVTQGSLKIDVVLLDPVKNEEFRTLITDLGRSGNPSLEGASLSSVPENLDQDENLKFTINTGTMTFSTDKSSPKHSINVEGTINEGISAWLSNQDTGNEISDPFLLNSAIGATVAGETTWRALLAIVAALVVVVMYIRIRFASVAWGIGAVVALLHDSFVVVGLIGLFDFMGYDLKIDLTVVAAILTVIGYSLNDTIITYDRIRELLRKDRLATGGKTPLKSIINRSINQMLPRTVLTSSTTLVTTLTMLAFGGPLLRGFAFAMSAGVIVGTFSSIYIAGPILLLFDRGEGGLLDLSDEELAEDDKVNDEDADDSGNDADESSDEDSDDNDSGDEAEDSEEESKDKED